MNLRERRALVWERPLIFPEIVIASNLGLDAMLRVLLIVTVLTSLCLAPAAGSTSPDGADSPSPPMWFDSGHRVVAAVAWDHMAPDVRDTVVRLLRQAPPDADLANMAPGGAEFDRALFMEASTWPDVIRSEEDEDRRERYHRGRWHYVNHFWASTPDGPLPLSHLETAGENATERLKRFAELVGEASDPASERAVQLAWIIHLVGDLHQPLHASSRVTPLHTSGDRGGGLFPLDGPAGYNNLHVYWDGILDISYPQSDDESGRDYALRLARHMALAKDADANGLENGLADIGSWARESTEIAQLSVYLPVLQRGSTPPETYRRHALRTSEERLRLAGLRLAALLNHLFA